MNFQNWCDSFTSIEFYNNYYEKYLKQFSNDSIPILDKLFEKIVFINEEKLSDLVEDFYNEVCVLCKDAVIISTVLDNRTHNSYNATLKLLEKINVINKPSISDLNTNNVIIFDDFQVPNIKPNQITGMYEVYGQDRSLIVFPLKWALTIFPPTGSLTNFIKGGHAKVKTNKTITLYYHPKW